MKTAITELLGIKYPIIQGGMAWVAEYHLAAAVSEAGGLGLIGAASAPAEVVREQIRKAKELTDKPFGVNVMLMGENVDEIERLVPDIQMRRSEHTCRKKHFFLLSRGVFGNVLCELCAAQTELSQHGAEENCGLSFYIS